MATMRNQMLRATRSPTSSLLHNSLCPLAAALSRLSISRATALQATSTKRSFSSSSAQQSWLEPRRGYSGKSRKGRPRVPTGGSTRGTTVIWGDYGLRMKDHDRRVSAKQLSVGMNTIRQRLRGSKYKIYTRIATDIPVFTSGNEMRMGKGKGTFDYFAARVAVSKIIFEVKGELHEKVVRDAFRLAAAKMPGQYEFVKKGDPPVMGLTKVPDAFTMQHLLRPRRDQTDTVVSETVPDIVAPTAPEVAAAA